MEVAHAGSEARRFGKYTLVAKLATGGMAEIFLARLHGDGGFEKLVCIKRILPHLAKDPQFVAMFLDEARVAARISHPNVCQVFELGEWNKQYYIAMEYLEGVPLSVFRRKEFYPTPPDPRLVAAFGVQACEGLHHAHQLKRADGGQLGVVHRDISPQNLFATVDGIVKVLDFGIAKVQDATVRTSTGAVKGTYAYMSPEQLRNDKLDRRADVWAIGVVLWETLAQQHLFKRDTEFLTFEAITKLPIPDICEVRPDVAPLLGDTIARALSRNPDDRFASARALGEALAQAVGPLGGPLNGAAIADEVERSFDGALAEQRDLLRIAREGGQFNLETSSPALGHGAQMPTTPVSNIQRRAQEAQAEVAHYVAATQALDSLFDEELSSDGRPAGRMGTDGAFTPAPSRGTRSQAYDAVDEPGLDSLDSVLDELPEARPERRSRPMAAQPERRSRPMAAQPERRSRPMGAQSGDDEQPRRRSAPMGAQPGDEEQPRRRSAPMAAQRRSQPYATAPAEWRYDETEPPVDTPRRASHPPAPVRASRVPWIIASISVAAAATTGILLYLKLSEKAAPKPAASDPPVAMAQGSAQPAAPAPAPPVEPTSNIPPPGSTSSPPDATSPSDDTAKPVAPAGAPIVPTVPDDDMRGDVDTSKKQTKSRKTTPKLDPKRDIKAEPVAEPAQNAAPGFITIDSAPVYAVIFINGKKYGETPLVNLRLPPGKHAVRAVSPSGATKNLSITIESGKTAPVRKISW